MKKKINIAVIIPCFKVKNNILFVVKKCIKYFDYVICVDDNCPEKSGLFVSQKFKSNKKVKVLFHKNNKGVGGAVKSGYRFLLKKNFDHIIKLDGDNQMDPSEYKNLIKPMYDKKICYTKGNRFLDKKYFSKSPKIRFYGNFILTLVSKLFIGNFKMGDPLNGYTCIRRDTLHKLNFLNIRDDFFFETSMLYELKRIHAKTEDVKVNIRYEGEISNFKLRKELSRFIYLHLTYLMKRIFS